MSSTVFKVAVSPGENTISMHPGARPMGVVQQGAVSNFFYIQKKYTPSSIDPLSDRNFVIKPTGDVDLSCGDEINCYICSYLDSLGVEHHVFECV